MVDSQYIDANEAARALGITRRTLYAYVSRGLLSSHPGPGPSRARQYSREEVDQLKRSRSSSPAERAAAGAMHWGTPVLESALTLIDDGRFFYRGRDAIQLSRDAALEEVATLLWTDGAVSADAVFASIPASRRSRQVDRPMLARMEAALMAARDDALASVSSPEPARLRAAAAAVASLFAAAGAVGAGRLSARLARGWGTPDADVLSAALVLCADHELNVSAFTARCIASADTKLEDVLLGALCAFQGRRHGGMGARVLAMVDEAARYGVDRALDRALSEQEGVPGFGHPLYPHGDPRAAELLRIVPPPDRDDVMAALEQTCATRLSLAPNLDFGLVALTHRRGLPADAGTALFALGRSVGWVAHAFEAWDTGGLIRPRARYVGRR